MDVIFLLAPTPAVVRERACQIADALAIVTGLSRHLEALAITLLDLPHELGHLIPPSRYAPSATCADPRMQSCRKSQTSERRCWVNCAGSVRIAILALVARSTRSVERSRSH